MSLSTAFSNFFVLTIPVWVFVFCKFLFYRASFVEIGDSLGLSLGSKFYVGIGLLASIPGALLAMKISSMTSGFEGSMIKPYIGQTPNLQTVSAALLYGFVATGIPEELLFRGLIGGFLNKRFRPWIANVLQSIIFLLPHLLIVYFVPKLWVIGIFFPLGLGLLNGWLLQKSKSIFPGILVHSIPNAAGALCLMNWSALAF